MSDVAKAAGVSTMTVSNVINGRPRVGEKTKQRVLATIAELGYQVNLTARHLRMGRTGVIGMAVPELEFPYFAELEGRLARRFARHGLRVAVEWTQADREVELATFASSRLRMYDGIVLSLVAGSAADLERISTDTPVILIGERSVPSRFDHVLMDNVDGARQATESLLARGARRILLLGGALNADEAMPQLRTHGYLAALRAARIEVDETLIVESSFRISDAHQSLSRAIESKIDFDAVFALTDWCALGALRALADAGLRVPDDVQVIGFDALTDGRYSVPSLSTVDPDNEAMADAICDLMLDRLQPEAAPREAQVVMPKAHLIHRESTRS
jgi:DNA-binding LacI/PurR family transcriptional regulator